MRSNFPRGFAFGGREQTTAEAGRLQGRLVRPHCTRRLPHRGALSAEDALGSPHRHTALLRLRLATGHYFHLPRPQDERQGAGSFWRAAERQPVCRRRNDGWQRSRQGLHGGGRHVDWHRIRANRRYRSRTPCTANFRSSLCRSLTRSRQHGRALLHAMLQRPIARRKALLHASSLSCR